MELTDARLGQLLRDVKTFTAVPPAARRLAEQAFEELLARRKGEQFVQAKEAKAICKGSMALGNGCGRCKNCRSELAHKDFEFLHPEIRIVISDKCQIAPGTYTAHVVKQE